MMKKLLLPLILVTLASLVSSQSRAQTAPLPVATLTLVAQVDSQTGDTIRYDGVMLIRADKISWGRSVTELSEFAVSGSNGSWDSTRNSGTVNWQVTFADMSGTITLTRDTYYVIKIDMNLNGQPVGNTLLANKIDYQ